MQRTVSKPWFYLLSALVAVLVAGIAVAGDEPVEVEKKIVVKTMHGMHGMHGMQHGGAFLGVGLSPLTPELRTHFGVPEDLGVMVSKVEADSPAARAGIEVGDIIARVGGDDIGSASALARNIGHREEGENVDLEVWRDGKVETVQATLAAREGLGMAGHHKMIVRCEDGQDCGHLGDFDCGGAEDCRVEVMCDGGDCQCTANGEDIDCAEVHPMHQMHQGHGGPHMEHHHGGGE